MNRSIGAAILGILAVLRGVIAILGGVQLASLSKSLMFVGHYAPATSFSIWSTIVISMGIVFLFLGYGLWNMQAWAWRWTLIFLVGGLFVDFAYYLAQGSVNWFSVVVSIIVIIYLLVPRVQAIYMR